MHPQDPDTFAGIPYRAEDSGSVYETSDAEQSPSHNKIKIEQSSRASSVRSRGRTGGRKTAKRSPSESEAIQDSGEEVDSEAQAQNAVGNEQIRKEAVEWAANFHPPTSPREIKLPVRKYAGSRAKRKRPQKESSEVKSKRTKAHSNPRYRELLNLDINDAAARSIPADDLPLPESQIGSSTWTSSEKGSFFAALSRLGRDNVRAIASRIETKSELEVQEYMQLLQKSLLEKKSRGKFPEPADLPAAFEVSEECCELLEKAGDALASRQERREVEIEKAKWGDSWLLNTDVSYWVNKRRNQVGGEEAINEVLPAANLFNLNNWLELSDRIFMNSAAPYEDDNWHELAEEEETPAFRATAFEDFHSLAVHITKKLVSTTLFCTMSRERAMKAQKIKHAEVNPGDVEAAVKILQMKSTSREFWTKAARRCNLQVINDDTVEESQMTYEEVELALGSLPPRSRSRSASHNLHTRTSTLDLQSPNQIVESSDEFESADESPRDYSSQDAMSMSLSDNELNATSRPSTPSEHATETAAYTQAQEEYAEALDVEASCLEELRLWSLLKRDPPFGIKPEPLDEPVKPKYLKREFDDGQEWREFVEFRSEWEMVETPVPDQAFERNRNLKRKRPRRDVGREGVGMVGELSSEFVDEDEEDLTSLDEERVGGDEVPEELGDRDQVGKSQTPDGEMGEEAQFPERGLDESVHITNWSSDEEQAPFPDEAMVAHFQSLASEFRVSEDEMSIKEE